MLQLRRLQTSPSQTVAVGLLARAGCIVLLGLCRPLPLPCCLLQFSRRVKAVVLGAVNPLSASKTHTAGEGVSPPHHPASSPGACQSPDPVTSSPLPCRRWGKLVQKMPHFTVTKVDDEEEGGVEEGTQEGANRAGIWMPREIMVSGEPSSKHATLICFTCICLLAAPPLPGLPPLSWGCVYGGQYLFIGRCLHIVVRALPPDPSTLSSLPSSTIVAASPGLFPIPCMIFS